jgi:sugar phosphate isomerase/epimerase
MELGESGEMDFNSIFKHKKEAGVQYGVVEVERYNFTPIESVKKSFDYIQTTNF